MGRRTKTQRVLKWIGTVFCVVIVAAAAMTLRWHAHWLSPHMAVGVGVYAGAAYANWTPDDLANMPPAAEAPSGVEVVTARSWSDVARRWSRYALWPMSHSAANFRVAYVPLWIVFVVAAVPTGVLWWRDRRRILPVHCEKCGYDLTGNVSGRCPECGMDLRPAGWDHTARIGTAPREGDAP